MNFILRLVLFLACTLSASLSWATLYEVGPGKTHSDLSTINWPNLQSGDEVHIYWRAEPYRNKIGIRARGTASSPVRIVGIKGPSGQRPVLSGNNATTPPSLNGFFQVQWTEFLGVIVIHPGPNDPWGYKPGYITIEGLKLEGGHKNYQYSAMDGQWRNYADGAAGIWAVVVENLVVRDCEFTDNGNGFFVLSKNSEEEVSRNVLFEKNYVHGNGIVGSDQEHNIYTQVAGITFQYNQIGPLRPGAKGIALKDRSANTVIRYNWIESGARTIDLVEPEDSYTVLMQDPGFRNTWVYGNIIINEYSSSYAWATSMIHYGGDMGDPSIYRKGTLQFFHNTVYIKMNQSDGGSDTWNVNLFDLSSNDEQVVMRNNILYREGDTFLYLARNHGIHIFEANNWINTGWENSSPNNEWHTFDGAVVINTAPITGTNPGLKNPSGHDFSVLFSSAVHDRSVPLLTSILSAHSITRQYLPHQQGMSRTIEGSSFELGALESEAGGISTSPLIQLLLLAD
jgi:hypothetical protein